MRPFCFAFVALALTVAVQGQDKHFVRASAQASVSGQPDQARLSIGVRTQALTALAATEENAAQSAAVLKTIKAILGTKGIVQTADYSISPHYEVSNNVSRENGFETSNFVEVTTDDLSLLPKLIDASAISGANSIRGISFSMKDDSALRLQALSEAARKAQAAAEAIAAALKLHIVGVADAESGVTNSPIRPLLQNLPLAGRAIRPVTIPIESGTLEVLANATVTLEVSR